MFISSHWHGQFLITAKWSLTSHLRNDELNFQGHWRWVRPWEWGPGELSVCVSWVCVILRDMAWWAQLLVWQQQRHSSDNCVHAEGSFQTGRPRPHREITDGQLPPRAVSCSGCWQLVGGCWGWWVRMVGELRKGAAEKYVKANFDCSRSVIQAANHAPLTGYIPPAVWLK